MAQASSEPVKREGLVLSGVAGAVDGIGYVLLHVFTAHITGNTVHVGTGVGRFDLGSAWRPAVAIAAFVAGVAVGALVRDACVRHGIPPRPVVLAVSGVLLVCFLGVGVLGGRALHGAAGFAALAAPAALAMGCQNAVMPRVGGRRVRTYITGTMTEFAEAVVSAATGTDERIPALRRALELFGVWFMYLVGGVVSGAAGTSWGAGAAVFPIAGLAIVIALDLHRWREEAMGSRAWS